MTTSVRMENPVVPCDCMALTDDKAFRGLVKAILACILVAMVGWMILRATKPARERAELERQAAELDEYNQ